MISRAGKIVSRLHATRSAFGWTAAGESLIDRIGDSLMSLQVIEVVWLHHSKVAGLTDVDPRFEFRFLSADEVRRFSVDPSLKLAPSLADRIDSEQDRCFAALQGSELCAYGWYAFDCIEGEHNFGVPMSFPSDTAYMYNGFTHPDFRGLRLHGQTMGLALRALKKYEVSSLVSTVDWTNQASIRSCDRLGYQRLGRLVTFRRDRSTIVGTPERAKRLGIEFGPHARQRQSGRS